MTNLTACAPSAHFHFRLFSGSGMTTSMDSPVSQRPGRDSSELEGLLRAVSGGDRRAFAMLYDRTSAKLYGICLRLMGSEAEAQDVLQEAYVKIWSNAGRFDAAKASPITWLAVVARNKAIDRLRQRVPATDGIESAAEVEDDTPSAFDLVGAQQDASRLADCLDELEEQPREAIRAAFLDGLSYPELAERDAVPLGTVKSWIRRGLQRLRGCLER